LENNPVTIALLKNAALLSLMLVPIGALAQTPETAPPTPAAAALESGLAGHWAGTLAYRDYQSDKMVSLPMRSNVVALADGATIIDIATFDDGPKRGDVIITTAYLFNTKAGTVENIALERGRPIDHYTDKAMVVSYTDPTHWIIVYQHEGTDGGKPALIRTSEVRDGEKIARQEDVRAPDSTDKDWRLRNKTILTRSEPKL
jgi:hypothetical protein